MSQDVVEIPESESPMLASDDVARELSIVHKICACHIKDLQTKSIAQV